MKKWSGNNSDKFSSALSTGRGKQQFTVFAHRSPLSISESSIYHLDLLVFPPESWAGAAHRCTFGKLWCSPWHYPLLPIDLFKRLQSSPPAWVISFSFLTLCLCHYLPPLRFLPLPFSPPLSSAQVTKSITWCLTFHTAAIRVISKDPTVANDSQKYGSDSRANSYMKGNSGRGKVRSFSVPLLC